MSPHRLLLAVECATRVASVALVRADAVLAVRAAGSDRHHAESLLAEIDALLRDGGAALSDVDAFAVTIGPGAFTSLRIGLATVKGLAFASDRPVAAVSTLAAVACAAPRGIERVAAVLDARRGEVYAGEFDLRGELPRPTGAEGVATAETLAARLPPGTRLIGEIPPTLVEQLRAAGRGDVVPVEGPDDAPRALAVARIGAAALRTGAGVRAAELVPRYLRRAEAEEKRLAASAASLDTGEKLQ